MTLDLAMHYATGPGGISGESRRFNYPASYYERHLVENDGWLRPDRKTRACLRLLLRKGWIELRERLLQIPAEPLYVGASTNHPAHSFYYTTYHATEKGRREWSAQKRKER